MYVAYKCHSLFINNGYMSIFKVLVEFMMPCDQSHYMGSSMRLLYYNIYIVHPFVSLIHCSCHHTLAMQQLI